MCDDTKNHDHRKPRNSHTAYPFAQCVKGPNGSQIRRGSDDFDGNSDGLGHRKKRVRRNREGCSQQQ